jgi:hypothetical protein
MVRGGKTGRAIHALALLAVALFSFATVRSVSMQAVMAASSTPMPMPMSMPMPASMPMSAGTPVSPCGAMSADPARDRDPAPHKKVPATCPFCAAAAHAPICTTSAVVRPSSTVAWAAYARLSPLGARGPPAFTPKSRGPPAPALTV